MTPEEEDRRADRTYVGKAVLILLSVLIVIVGILWTIAAWIS